MAKPLQSGKQSVDLARGGAPVSRIRRDPPPPVKRVTLRDARERDKRIMIVGILSFSLALFAILIGLSSYNGWTPRDYTIDIRS